MTCNRRTPSSLFTFVNTRISFVSVFFAFSNKFLSNFTKTAREAAGPWEGAGWFMPCFAGSGPSKNKWRSSYSVS